MDKFIKYNSKSELHRELTNILLLATEDSNDFYCFCDKFYETRSKCDLCALCEFLFDENNLMDGLSPKKFLQLNYNNRLKLEEFANKITAGKIDHIFIQNFALKKTALVIQILRVCWPIIKRQNCYKKPT